MSPTPVGSGDAIKQRRGSFSSIVVASGVVTELVGPSENRVALVLTPNAGAELQYSPFPTNSGHQSINLGTSAGPLVLRYEDVGDIVKKAWYILFTTGGNIQVGFIETFTD